MPLKCDCCKKVVKSGGEAALGCSRCDMWRHARCFTPPIQADTVKSLEQSHSLHFICDKCESDAAAPKSDDPKSNEKLAQAIDKLTATLNAFESRLTNIEEKVESLAGNVPSPQQVVDLVRETIERRENRSQLVVVGVAETDVDDNNYVGGLFQAIGANGCIPSEIYRMGRLSEDPRKPPRLIKVRFSRSWMRDEVLAKAKVLRDSDTYKGVFIRPSYTSRERKLIASMYDQKRELERDGGTYFIRRQGPVDEWEIVRDERAKNNRRDTDTDPQGEWQTVQSRRRPQIFVPAPLASINSSNTEMTR